MKSELKSIIGLAIAGSLAACGVQSEQPKQVVKTTQVDPTPAKKAEEPEKPTAKILSQTHFRATSREYADPGMITEFNPHSMPDKTCIAVTVGKNGSGGVAATMQCFDTPATAPKGP